MLENNFTVDVGKERKNFIAKNSFEKSKDEIMGTWNLTVPYTLDNWHWWAPHTLNILIYAGVFDSKKVFNGRTSEALQSENQIDVKLVDCGWMLKQKYSGEDYSGDIKDVLSSLITQAGLKPILRGVVSEKIDRTTVWASSSSSSSSSGDCVCFTGKPSCAYECGPFVDTKKCWVNKCPFPSCGGEGTLIFNPKGTKDGEITCSKCGADFCVVCGREKLSPSRARLTACTASKSSSSSSDTSSDTGSVDTALSSLSETGSVDTSSSNSSSSDTSEETQVSDSKSYEDELKQICNPRDYHIIVNQEGECIIMTPDVPAKADFVVKPWMMKKETFSYNVNLADGNSFEGSWIPVSTEAIISYNNGTAVIRNPELYAMYGAINVIKESQPKMHRDEAENYGRKLLAKSARDSNIEINFTMLLTGEVYPGRWIEVTNPKTGVPEILWVDTISLTLDPSEVYEMQVKCLYMPKTPDVSSGGNPASLEEIGVAAGKFSYCHACQTAECMEKKGCGDCWAMSDFIYKKCIAAGIPAKIVEYPTSMSQRHRSVLVNIGNGWEDFPYRKKAFGINSNFYNTSGSKKGKTI